MGGVSKSEKGVGSPPQAWADYTASRALGTTYYNTTGRTIVVCLTLGGSSAGSDGGLQVSGLSVGLSGQAYTAGAILSTVCALVPPGAPYVAYTNLGTVTISQWRELR